MRRCRGLSLMELLVSLAISALLLTATMTATVASFRAYGDAVEQAGTQVSVRMVTQRLLALIRTSSEHGPLLPDAAADPPVTISGDTISSNYLELIDTDGNFLRVEYRTDDHELWLIRDPGLESESAQPIIAGVTNAVFQLKRRLNDEGLYVLERATVDLTVAPDEDATLALENGPAQAVRMITSTMPRKLE